MNLRDEMNRTNQRARTVLESWAAAGLSINKYNDATEPYRVGLTVAEGAEIATEDASLIFTDAYAIDFEGFEGAPDTTGYQADDYLPGYAGKVFAHEADAQQWLLKNHKGADKDGVTAIFGVVEVA